MISFKVVSVFSNQYTMCARLEVLTAVLMEVQGLLDMMPCELVNI